MYRDEIEAAVDDLGLHNIDIRWSLHHRQFVPGQRRCAGWTHTLGAGPGKWIWFVDVATKWPYREAVDTIFHEARHIKQWEAEWLTDADGTWVWTGTVFVPALTWTGKLAYMRQPQEMDAREYAKDAWFRLFDGRKVPETRTPKDYIRSLML